MAIVKKISELTPKGSALANTDLLIVGVDNGTDYDLKSITGAQVLGNVVSQTITDGVTTKAPSENVVFDALALKVDKELGHRLITSGEATILDNTSGINTGDQDLSGYQLTSGKDATSGYVGISPSNSIVLPIGRAFVSNNVTPNQIAYFDNSGNLLTLSVATYPSISELSYVKGVTSAIQTQLNGKVTGSGTSSGVNTGDQVISDETINLTDITTNNVSSTKHGFAPKTPNNTNTFLRGDGTWATPSAGGLTYFTEAQNTTSPNATVPVDSLTAVASTTNADMALLPKGTGAFIVGHIPDGSTGGLKRGAGAIELQSGAMYYDGATGANSVVIGKGSGATATGAIAIGTNCNASGNYSLSLGGVATGLNSVSINGILSSGQSSVAMSGATASGTNSFAFGTATASGVGSFAIGGEAGGTANASSAYCTAIGSATTASGRYSMAILSNSNTFTHGSRFSYGSYNSSANNPVGSIQGSTLVTGADTTTATPTTLGNYGGTVIPLILQNNNSIRFKGTIIGRQSGSTNTSAWDIDGFIQRGTTAATTTLLISNVNLIQNTPAWGTPTLTADTTNGGLDIKVIGAATTNIRWTCVFTTTEVILA